MNDSDLRERFPRSSRYAAAWINEGGMGGNPHGRPKA
jgi:hypothetical protein